MATTGEQAQKFNKAYDVAHAEYTGRHRTSSLAALQMVKTELVHTLSLASTKADIEHEGYVTGALVAIGELIAHRQDS